MFPFSDWKSGLCIYLFWGKKGQGKSYFQYRLFENLVSEYYTTEKKYPFLPHRKYWSSQKFSDEVDKRELGKHLEYWTHPEQLYNLRDVDIGWDEIGKDLPASGWADTPKELKQIFSHLRKRGNRLFCNTQNYEDIDISFRRQIDRAFRVQKIFGSRDISATLPPVKRVWGLIDLREFDPVEVENERDESQREELDYGWPQFYLIRRKYVDGYNTQMELPPYKATKMREEVMECQEGDACKDPRHRYRIKHIPY